VGHLAHLIQAVLGDGDRFKVKIDYSVEDFPLGTAGPLAEVNGLDDTFLVVNGDVLTNLDFRSLRNFHRDSGAVATVAIHKRWVNINYGVVRRSGDLLAQYDEKPTIDYEVSMGVYVFESRILDFIPGESYLDFPDLVRILLDAGERVAVYSSDGIWYDLGRPEDFQAAHDELDDLRNRIPFFKVANSTEISE
jgi:NDP-sugar pyrophosphorylase family protein